MCRLNLPFNRAEDAIDKVIAVNPDLKSKTVKDCNTLHIDLVGLKGIFFPIYDMMKYCKREQYLSIYASYIRTYIHTYMILLTTFAGYSPHLAIRLIQEFKISNRYCMYLRTYLRRCIYAYKTLVYVCM